MRSCPVRLVNIESVYMQAAQAFKRKRAASFEKPPSFVN